ncbi:hypothetical protein AYK26_06880 [Euryarchaeota archaeon SM23-78]|nr:MAG: hypothetical protein AYK26_06880 [Euryarchaeota archaeon SM23-78]MBW3000387.1 hypothetical protein [Candidatus Woesearchaeota archaeon]
MSTKGQLSIETMIIYGLVILVTLSVIGGLLYFNILDLGSYLPDKCDLGGTGDVKCEEMKFVGDANSGTLELGVRNIGQKPIETLSVSVTDGSGIHFSGEQTGTGELPDGTAIGTGVGEVSLPPGEIAKITIDTGKALPGKLLRGTLKTTYKFAEGAITQESTGSIRIKAS